MSEKPKQSRGEAVRDKFVDIAADLFYRNGIHAIGVDEVVRQAGMAKASLYRWFPSKDDRVLAVLQRRDENFWAALDATTSQYVDPLDELNAQLAWIQDLATREGYRGCAFVNAAAEFGSAQPGGIQERCLKHEEELRRRLRLLTAQLDTTDSDGLADCLHIAIMGAFALGGLYPTNGPAAQLRALADQLISAGAPTRSSEDAAVNVGETSPESSVRS
jgi:AcrR family transcriptional regulator